MKRFSFVLFVAAFATASLADNKTSLANFLSDDTQSRKDEQENFDRRMRQVREDSAIDAERDRLNRERQVRESGERKQGFHPLVLPDLSKQPKWRDIEAGSKYQALSEIEQRELKSKYFDDLISPHVLASGGDVATLRQQFMEKDLPWYELAMRRAVDYWAYGVIGISALLITLFRRRVAVVGRYVVDNAFRIAALAGALAFIVFAIRTLQGPVFVFLR